MLTRFLDLKGYLTSLALNLSIWRQFLATESPLKIIKNVFYFTLRALFIPQYIQDFVLNF